MNNITLLRNILFSFLIATTFLISGSDLFAQPEIKSIDRYKPSEQNTEEYSLTWKVVFTEPISEKTIEDSDFEVTVVKGEVYSYLNGLEQFDKGGYEWLVYVGIDEYTSKTSEIRLDFTGYVENTKGTPTSKGYTFTKGQTYTYGSDEPVLSEVTAINRYIPNQQYSLAGDLTWLVYFSGPIDSKSIDSKDFTLTRVSGTVGGTISTVTRVNDQQYQVKITGVTGTGNLKLDFTGTVTNPSGDNSKNTFTSGAQYTILDAVTAISSNRNNPVAQITKLNSVTWRVDFSRAINAATLNSADFDVIATSGVESGTISNVTGSGSIYFVTLSGVTQDADVKLNFIGTVNDTYNLPSTGQFTNGQEYTFDYTAPKMDLVHIQSNNTNQYKAIPENMATVSFRANEIVNIISFTIRGEEVIGNGSGSIAGNANYLFDLSDVEGLVEFEFTVEDIAGNRSTFNKTTDNSFVEFSFPVPQAVIIEQPSNLIACIGSLDKFLFVVASSDIRGYDIAYRWWKDGQVISNWTPDFGQITFDELDYDLSGSYQAEVFAFNPKWKSAYGNPFSLDSARVSEKVFSKSVNLYVLQRPSFLRNINSITSKAGEDLTITFEANIYGEHNMVDPTYWTEIDWYKGTDELVDTDRIAGSDASILTIKNLMNDDFSSDYRVRLIGECDTVWSNTFAISDEPQAIVTVQPLDVEGCVDDVVQITVEADATILNTNLTYQWMVNGTPIMDEAGKFNGANSASMNVTLNPALGYDGTEMFTCNVWPVGYPNNGAMSTAAMITWKTAPEITVNPFDTYTAKEGEDILIFITVVGEGLTYTWTHDGVDLGIDNDSLVLSSVEISDAGAYKVSVSNGCGGTSRTVGVEVTPGPIVTSVDAITGLGLRQNFPNPFDVNSTITFNTVVSGNASLVMTDMLGNTVAPLFNGFVNKNNEQTIQLNVNELNLNTGTYFITLRMGERVETRQISVVR